MPYPDMTASEIARELGYVYLEKLLTPTILHHLPTRVAVGLEDQLHRLLNQILGDDIQRLCLRLPEISVLTELEQPTMDIVLPNTARIGVVSTTLSLWEQRAVES